MNNIISQRGDGYFISYLAQRSDEAAFLDELCHIFGGRPSPQNKPETALVVSGVKSGPITDKAFYILYGDHREAYSKLSTLDECMQYFINNIHLIGHSSDTPKTSA